MAKRIDGASFGVLPDIVIGELARGAEEGSEEGEDLGSGRSSGG